MAHIGKSLTPVVLSFQVVAKQKKNKKKKSKQLLTLEVNFSDRKEDTLLGENSVLSDEEQKETAK